MSARTTLTPEQLQKKEERRARFRQLVQKVAAMSDQEREDLASRLLGLRTVEGHPLSGNNCCLIWCQLPTATLLGGFRQWLDHGRCVRKGEHGHDLDPDDEEGPRGDAARRRRLRVRREILRDGDRLRRFELCIGKLQEAGLVRKCGDLLKWVGKGGAA